MENRFRKKSPPVVMTFPSRKGGVGKTFSAISAAISAATGGPSAKYPPLKVLFIDADSQQNASYFFLKTFGAEVVGKHTVLPPNPNCENNQVYNISDIIAGNEFLEYPTDWENISIIPSDGRIDEFTQIATIDLHDFPDDVLEKFAVQLFDELIDLVQDDYDVIIIDTPPSKTHASLGAIASSTHCMVVGMPDVFSALNGIPGTIADIQDNNATYRNEGNQTEIIGILINKISSMNPTKHERQHIDNIKRKFPDYFNPKLYMCNYVDFNTEIPQKPGELAYFKNPTALKQMEQFYDLIAESALSEIYGEGNS